MNNRMKLMIKLFFVATASTLLASGCSKDKEVPIVTINDKSLYMEDFLYDIYEVESEGNEREAYYQKMLGYSYWDYQYNGSSMRETAKNMVLASVVMYEILSDQAAINSIELSDVELAEDDAKIDSILSDVEENEYNHINLTREILEKALHKISLGKKYRNELLHGYKIDENALRDSINPDDYREYRTECLFIPTVKTEDDSLIAFSQKEKDAACTLMSAIYDKFKKGEGFDQLLNEYPKLTYQKRNFIQGEKEYEKEYYDAALVLNNDEYSQIIATDYGYYLIHMLDNNSTDRYEKAVEDMIVAEEDKQFSVIYNDIKKQYDININFDYWDTITIGAVTTTKE